MSSYSLQNGPLNFSPKPNPGLPLFVIRILCFSAWISIAYFQAFCHHGLTTCGDTICYTLLVFLDSHPLPFRTASSCCQHHSP